MSVYRIREYGEPILRKQCVRLDNAGLREKEILAKMARTMYKAKGIGLAAPQIGIERQLIVIDVGEGLIKLINPLLISEGGESILEEGCLSLSEITVKARRANRVIVQGWNEQGKIVKIEGENLFAHALQHEIDHLSGVLIIDYVSSQERDSFQDRLRELQEKARVSPVRGRTGS